MAKLGKKPCVVSTHNMVKNYKDRLIKVSIHETGIPRIFSSWVVQNSH